MLSLILMNRPHIHVGAPKSHQALALPPSGSSSNLQDQVDVSALVLALQTLGNFDFEVCAHRDRWTPRNFELNISSIVLDFFSIP